MKLALITGKALINVKRLDLMKESLLDPIIKATTETNGEITFI